MKQITQSEMRELKALLATVGLEVKKMPKPKADKSYVWKGVGRGVFWYKGISNDQVKGVLTYYKGPLYQAGKTHTVEVEETTYTKSKYQANALGGPWPSDIAAYYAEREQSK